MYSDYSAFVLAVRKCNSQGKFLDKKVTFKNQLFPEIYPLHGNINNENPVLRGIDNADIVAPSNLIPIQNPIMDKYIPKINTNNSRTRKVKVKGIA